MTRLPLLHLPLTGTNEQSRECVRSAPQLETLETRDLPALFLVGTGLPMPASLAHQLGDAMVAGPTIANELLPSVTAMTQSGIVSIAEPVGASTAEGLPVVHAGLGSVLSDALHSIGNIVVALTGSTPPGHAGETHGSEDKRNVVQVGDVADRNAIGHANNVEAAPVAVTDDLLPPASENLLTRAVGNSENDFPTDAALTPFAGPAIALTNPGFRDRLADEQGVDPSGLVAPFPLGQRNGWPPIVRLSSLLEADSLASAPASLVDGPNNVDLLAGDHSRIAFDVSPERSASAAASAGEGLALLDAGDQGSELLPLARETDDFAAGGFTDVSLLTNEPGMGTSVLPHRGMGIARIVTLIPTNATEIADRAAAPAMALEGQAEDLPVESLTGYRWNEDMERTPVQGAQSVSTNDGAWNGSIYQQLLGLAGTLGLSSYCVQMHQKAKSVRVVKGGARTFADSLRGKVP